MSFNKNYYVYIITNTHGNVMYTGMTNDLVRRIYEHKNKSVKGFSAKFNVDKLVYFEKTDSVEAAILREKQIKGWRREKKDRLVESLNPDLKDLSLELIFNSTLLSTGDSSLRSE